MVSCACTEPLNESCLSRSFEVTRKRGAGAARRKSRAQDSSGGFFFVCVSVFSRKEGAYFYIK